MTAKWWACRRYTCRSSESCIHANSDRITWRFDALYCLQLTRCTQRTLPSLAWARRMSSNLSGTNCLTTAHLSTRTVTRATAARVSKSLSIAVELTTSALYATCKQQAKVTGLATFNLLCVVLFCSVWCGNDSRYSMRCEVYVSYHTELYC
jgi:hypothetical protein